MAGRLQVLSEPKKDFLRHSDLRSVYWRRGGADGGAAPPLTKRQLELSAAKILSPAYRVPRDAAWATGAAPLSTAPASSRVLALAKPKGVYSGYEEPRDLTAPPSEGARNATASERLNVLARPRPRPKRANERSMPELAFPVTRVQAATLNAKCTARLENLSVAKDANPSWEPPRRSAWRPTKGALQAAPSDRVVQLCVAKPKVDKDADYDPYLIPSSALMARASERTNELSVPVARRQRARIVFKKKEKQ